MSKNPSSQSIEYCDLVKMILEQKAMLQLLIPQKASISYIAQSLGKSNESVRQFLINHYEESKDFWKEGGKIMVSQKTTIALLMRNTR